MWRKPNEGPAPTQPGQPPAPSASTPSSPPAAPQVRPPEPTIFGKSMKIVGQVTSEEELFVDGDLEGSVESRNRLTIGPESKVNANIKAKEVVVFGTVRGNVESETRVSLRNGASIVGDIKTAGIVIEDGAYFKGGIDISRGGDMASPAAKASGASAGQKR